MRGGPGRPSSNEPLSSQWAEASPLRPTPVLIGGARPPTYWSACVRKPRLARGPQIKKVAAQLQDGRRIPPVSEHLILGPNERASWVAQLRVASKLALEDLKRLAEKTKAKTMP